MDEHLSEFLKTQIKHFDRIVLAGDLFELWPTNAKEPQELLRSTILESHSLNAQSTRPIRDALKKSDFDNIQSMTRDMGNSAWYFWGRQQFEAISRAFPLTMKLLGDDRIMVLNGNHDALLRTHHLLPGVRDHVLLDHNGCRIMIAHGHHAEAQEMRVAQAATEIFQSVVKGFNSELDHALDQLVQTSSQFAPVARAARSKLLRHHANQLAKDHNLDAVILGHSGTPEIFELANCMYGNCGRSRGADELDALEVHLDRGKLEFHQMRLKWRQLADQSQVARGILNLKTKKIDAPQRDLSDLDGEEIKKCCTIQ